VHTLADRVLFWLVVAVSLAFAWILWPFFGAVLWAIVLAIVFAPLYWRIVHLIGQRPNLAALATVLIILTLVIVPLSYAAAALVEQAADLYARIQSGDLNLGNIFKHLQDALPAWVTNLLDRFGLRNFSTAESRVTELVIKGSQFFGTQALSIGHGAADFVFSVTVMLYLLYFLLRDGNEIARGIERSIPLPPEQQSALVEKFTAVIRATIKGNILVAALQGALGGLIFWILGLPAPVLWGVVMALLSLLPAIGSALVWVPTAIYLLLTGSIWQGIVLFLFGAFVIGLIDNFLRPRLVGHGTNMPDYIALISTLGGLATFGLNGFIVGPIVAALFIAVWHLFSQTMREQS
jgi:predicted PurR-regulated permease PerM